MQPQAAQVNSLKARTCFYDFAEALAKEQADRLKAVNLESCFPWERKLNKLKTRMSLLDDHKHSLQLTTHEQLDV